MVDDGGEESASPADVQQGEVDIPAEILRMDSAFRVLSHPRRRYILYTLGEKTEWTLRELATKLAAWELEIPEETVTTHERNQVYVSLLHAHIPKLVEEDVVEFDHEDETLEKSQYADEILNILSGLGASVDSAQQSHAEREYHE